MRIYNGKNMHNFMQQQQDVTFPKTRSNRFQYWLLIKVYKITHKQCTNKKVMNVDITTFMTFLCVPKLAFGNVY